MKKKIKKLSLNKKTISSLNLQTQNQIKGGDNSDPSLCQTCRDNDCPTDHTYCGPCDNTYQCGGPTDRNCQPMTGWGCQTELFACGT
ncbi:hypothetical protein SAMN02927921_01576 [Sinomicrobium oceani]|uniref:Uncharacterized protein n=1 Tax=Sinomicrobium oceani TaxID=1150368 RepID=A0A1K1P4Z8_9FLAO|nr:class I lanthipeptide [Sinomicrobium oceani]SFW41766.1 hypothetical protein SAMN02927921_01576 [Sinomicrobium oceani]